VILVPIRTARGQNSREHWCERSQRVKAEREAVAWLLKGQAAPMLPCEVLLTRLSPRGQLDDDNLSGSLKAVRDEVARWLGVDDGRDTVRYRYAQARGEWAVRIEFVDGAIRALKALEQS
jgi:hypothetical protein